MDAPLIVPTKHEISGSSPHLTIGQEVENRLHRCGYLVLRTISCDVRNGVIHLRGRVPSYYLKQIAQVIAGSIEDPRSMINDLEVIAPTDGTPNGHDHAASVKGRSS